MRPWWVIGLCACGPSDDDPEPDLPHRGVDHSSESGAPEPDLTGVADPCEADSTLSIDVDAAMGIVANQVVLRVTTSAPASVVARCVARSDPSEVHFLESGAARSTHTLVVGGLIASTDYDCAVAASCPATAAVTVPWTTGEAPSFLVTTEVEVSPDLGGTAGYTLANWRPSECGQPGRRTSWMAMWDPRGTLRWWWEMGPEYGIPAEVNVHATEPWIGWGGGHFPEGYPKFVSPTAGLALELVDLPRLPGALFSHELRTLPDGRILTLEHVPNARGPLRWNGFAVRAWDPAAEEVTFELNSQELVDAGILLPPSDGAPDPYHANAFDWEEDLGPELVLSLCKSALLLSYDVTAREVRWVLGPGRGWTVLDAAGAPLTDDDLPQCTHGIEVEGSRLLVHDNGQTRLHSSVSEWEIDGATTTARRTALWTEPGWYEPWLGDVEDLGEGRLWITQGRKNCGQRASGVEVVRETGEVAVRTTFPVGAVYRSERVDACRWFSSARDCPEVAARLEEVEQLFR